MKPLWEVLKIKQKNETYTFSHLSFKILTFEIQRLEPEIIIEMSDTERGN